MALLSFPKYATEVFHNPPRSRAGLGWWRPGLSSGCDWSHPCRHWLLIGCCTSDHSPAIRCSESRTSIMAEWKYTKAAKKNIKKKSSQTKDTRIQISNHPTHSTFLLQFRTWEVKRGLDNLQCSDVQMKLSPCYVSPNPSVTTSHSAHMAAANEACPWTA